MGMKTINGCLNLSTKRVVFQGEACDSGDYTGCYVASGIHAGMIAVVISDGNTDCDDTYYACFNPGTGQFNLSISDECCCLDTSCRYCTGTLAPEIQLTFSGIDWCQNWMDGYPRGFEILVNINSTFILPIQADTCLHHLFIENTYRLKYNYGDWVYFSFHIIYKMINNYHYIKIYQEDGYPESQYSLHYQWFYNTSSFQQNSGCNCNSIEYTMNNLQDECPGYVGNWRATDGQCLVSEF
jgi:hypothetical protein